ncbi:MAG: M24 family metallopeptidase [Candidatus Eisenbacteria bacterium]|uniref:Xaa-Pro aminopeptidase n=1 Tax=Eiseniibacteriota bacterium TaxID=2212470 RepID=A0A933SDZ5_UNCEI|nr:M24 family metallopeptidase [Candidatus Eisenbacteria bacterium]
MTTPTALLEQRRARAAAAFATDSEIILIPAGHPIGIPGGADQTYPYLAHAEYFWLTDHEFPGGVLAYDPKEGWTDFVPETTVGERVWEGRGDAPGTPFSKFEGWLGARSDRRVILLGAGGAGVSGIANDDARAAELRDALMHARRPKDSAELERLRAACAASAVAYERLRPRLRAGVSERELQIELEADFFRAGGDRTGYGSIVALGSNSAVLHFAPGDRRAVPGDVVLVDAGAEIRRYTSDVTRTYRVAGGDAGFFRELYTVVLGIEECAVAGCLRGAEWRDLHMQACHGVLSGLREMGLVKGDPAALVERDVHALFFPHGLGHLVGLGVRDASGYLPGRVRSTRPGLNMLRTDLPLERDYVITVEPGIYFIPALLRDPEKRAKYADCVAWDRVDALESFGGIRIEDDVRITDGAPEILTAAIPKSLDAAVLA